jgi:uncharacterized protein (TIGR00730 family)
MDRQKGVGVLSTQEEIAMTEIIRKYKLDNEALNQAIDALIKESGIEEHSDLLRQLMTTAFKLQYEKVDRGDLKLLNTSLKELRWAFRVFRPYRHMRKVSVFGSARTKESSPVFKMASQFSKVMVESGWMIVTGGSTGIMHAGNEGAGRAHSFGANIKLPAEQDVNPVIVDDKKLIHFKYFFTRKLIFVKESNAICLFPGGYGTLDEGYESLTLIQTGKMMPRPIVLMEPKGGTYWKGWLQFIKKCLLAQKMIEPTDLNLFTVTDDVKKARDIILNFYRIFNSMRFVGDKLVIRLQRSLSMQAIKKLNREFKDILVSGNIRTSGALAVEANEPEVASLPRLICHFDRRSFGRLKMMVDRINNLGD